MSANAAIPEKLQHEKAATEKAEHRWKFRNKTRYLILASSTLCLSLIVSNSMIFNFTVICMRNDTAKTEDKKHFSLIQNIGSRSTLQNASNADDLSNDKIQQDVAEPQFTLEEEGWLFSAVAIGTLIGTLPIAKITEKFGVRVMITGYGLLSAFAVLALPISAAFGFWALFVVRVVQGFAIATSYLAIGAISAEWSPLKQSDLFVCLISCHFQFGPIIAMPLAGLLCESRWGWPMAYYVLGVASLASFAVFVLFFQDSPLEHRNVGSTELFAIRLEKESSATIINGKIPFFSMILDPVMWGIFVSNVGATFGNQIFVQYGPLYLNKALGLTIQKTGFSAAFPFLLASFMKMMAGPLSDRLSFLSNKIRIILFTSVSQYVMAGLFLTLILLPGEDRFAVQLCFTLVTMFAGFWQVGAVKATQLASGRFASVIFAMNTFTSYVIVLGLPAVVNSLAPDNTAKQWGRIFTLIALMQCLCTSIFNFLVEVEPRAWTRNEECAITAKPKHDTATNKVSSEMVIVLDNPEQWKKSIRRHSAESIWGFGYK